ncbi:MAG: AsmA family protein [Enhydrobacter sp.]|nr:MAG: AsmA family protein [Enhydrobacter sp.]
MRISWRLLMILVATGAVVVTAAIAWSSTRDLSRYQARLSDQIRKATGRELATRVPLSIQLGREPALVAEGVTLTNASWAARPELARVRRLTMHLDLFSLLLGEVKVGRMLLEGADIQVERNAVGDSNLEMLPPPDGSGPHPRENRSLRLRPDPAFPWIGTIEVRDSVLSILQGPGRTPVTLEVAQATLKSGTSSQALQIEARLGAPKSAQFDFSGSIGSFDGWMRGQPGNIDLQGGFDGGRINVKGNIGAKGTNLQVTAEGSDIAAFGPYIEVPLPSGGPYSLTAKALTLRGNFKVDLLSLKVGESEMSGEALFRSDRQGVPNVTINVDAPKLDMAWLRSGQARHREESPTPAQRRLVPSAPFSVTWLGRSTLSLTVRVGEIVGLSGKVQNGSLTLVSGEKRFAFRAAASIGQGSAGFDLVYDPAGRTGQSTLSATASRVSLEDLASLLGLDVGLKDSVADLDVRLRGAGRTVGDALATASGTVEMAITKGVWPEGDLSRWPTETLRLLVPGEGGAPFNCLAGRFEVSGGIANLRRLVVDTPRATWVGGGYVHLRAETWEMLLVPEARDVRNAALAVPLQLKGGTGQQTSGSLDPNVGRLLIGRGVVPSLVAALAQGGRQSGANACAVMAPKVEALRPGLRAQLPAPPARNAPRRPR